MDFEGRKLTDLDITSNVNIPAHANSIAFRLGRIAFGKDASLSERMLGGGAWAFGGRIILVLCGLILNGLLARLLSPDDMGSFAFTLSLAATAATIAQLGLGPTVVRLIASSSGRGDFAAVRISIQETFKWAGVGTFLVAAIIALYGERFGIASEINLLAAIWVIILAGQQLLAEIARGFQDIRSAILLSGGARIGGLIPHFASIALLIGAWILRGSLGLEGATIIVVFGAVISFLAGILIVKRAISFIGVGNPGDASDFTLNIMPLALPVCATMVASLVWSQSAVWIIQANLPSSDTAIYNAAWQLVLLVSFTLSITNFFVPPLIAEFYAREEIDRLERLLRRTATFGGIPALVGVGILVVAGNPLLGVIYGDFYRSGATVMLILAVGNIARVLTGSCGVALVMTGHQMSAMTVTVFSGLVTIGAALIVVGSYGLIGVAVAMSVGTVLHNISMMLLAKHLIGVWTFMGL